MRPVDVFFRSLRDAFGPSDAGPNGTWIAAVIALGVALMAGWALLGRYRRRRAATAELKRVLATRHVGTGDARLLDRMAKEADIAPLLVATHVDSFERATAVELAQRAPSHAAGSQGVFAQILRLREALGFRNLPEHFPLLTTRELVDGMRVETAGAPGRVVEVNEACFVVGIPQASSFALVPEGESLAVSLVRGHEARYVATCRLLARELHEDQVRLVFRHDEQPSRIQLRAAVRVSAHGTVHLRPVLANPAEPDSEDVAGALLDISLGGIALETKSKVAVGQALRASFDLDGRSFQDLAAWVLECEPRRRGSYRLRLKFRELPASDETALSAVVAHRSAKAL